MRIEHAGGAATTQLLSDIDDTALGLSLADPAGWPTGAVGVFVATCAAGTPNEERILCTSRSGNAVVISVRGWDGTTARSHSSGVEIIHSFSASEADQANAHVEQTTGTAHGLVLGEVVKLNASQTLTNKIINGGSNTISALPQSALPATSATTSTAQTLTNKNLTDPSNTFPSTIVTETSTDVLTNKDLSSGTNTFPAALATLTGSQTLTNKNLTAPTIADFTNAAHDHGDTDDGGNIGQGAVTGLTAALAGVVTSTGTVASAGWTVTTQRIVAYGIGLASVCIVAQRTGATISPSAGLNIVGDSEVCTLPSSFPFQAQAPTFTFAGVGWGGAAINIAGVITLESCSSDINNGASIRLTHTYPTV